MTTGSTNARESRFAGHAALWVVQLCFAFFPIFGTWAFRQPGGFEPLAVGAWRMIFGSLSLGAIAFAMHGRRAIPARSDLGLLFVGSLLGITANMLLYLEGLHHSTATNAAILMGLIPVFTFTIAAFVRQEHVRPLRFAGVVIALIGASMRFWAEDAELASGHAYGNALMALNTLCYAAYFVLTRPLARRYPPIVVIAWVFAFSLPFTPFLAYGHPLVPEHVSARAWWSLAFILVFPTSLAYLLNVYALARLPASTAAIYVFVQPIITATASYFLLGEVLTGGMLASAFVTFLGIYLVSRAPRAASRLDGNPART